MVYFKKMFDGRGRDGQRGGKRREEGRDGVDKRADVAGADRGAGAWGTLCPLVKPQAWEFRLEDSLGSTQPGKRLLIKPSCPSEKWRWRSIFFSLEKMALEDGANEHGTCSVWQYGTRRAAGDHANILDLSLQIELVS